MNRGEPHSPQWEYYRIAVVFPDSREVLIRETEGKKVLPILTIPRWSRAAIEIQAAADRFLEIRIRILNIVAPSLHRTGFVIAEADEVLYASSIVVGGSKGTLDSLSEAELIQPEMESLETLFGRKVKMSAPFLKIGWLREVLDWIRDATGKAQRLERFRQWNASGQTSLVHFVFSGGTSYWFKAISPATSHEYRFTLTLGRLYPDFLARFVAYRDDWGALLMRDEGSNMAHAYATRPETMETVGKRLAQLQMASMKDVDMLLATGFADMRLSTLRSAFRQSLPVLNMAMALQDFDGVRRLSATRLNDICSEVEELCDLTGRTNVRDALIHNDLRIENILIRQTRCVFIDWAQPSVGHPLLSFEQVRSVLSHTPQLQAHFMTAYRNTLTQTVERREFEGDLANLPPLAAAIELLGCIARFAQYPQEKSRHFRHIRGLTRHLDKTLENVHPRKRSA